MADQIKTEPENSDVPEDYEDDIDIKEEMKPVINHSLKVDTEEEEKTKIIKSDLEGCVDLKSWDDIHMNIKEEKPQMTDLVTPVRNNESEDGNEDNITTQLQKLRTEVLRQKAEFERKHIHIGSPPIGTNKPYICVICSITFTFKQALYRHLQIHTKKSLKQCDICCKILSRGDSLNAHKANHTGEKLYACNTCAKQFSRKYDLKRHIDTHERTNFKAPLQNEKGSFSCAFCEKYFSSRNSLSAHMSVHKMYNYFCKVCNKSFSRKSNLVEHMKLHTGSRPFSCGYCPKSFTSKSSLRTHVAIHMEQKFSCLYCQKSYNYKHHLSRHKCVIKHGDLLRQNI